MTLCELFAVDADMVGDEAVALLETLRVRSLARGIAPRQALLVVLCALAQLVGMAVPPGQVEALGEDVLVCLEKLLAGVRAEEPL